MFDEAGRVLGLLPLHHANDGVLYRLIAIGISKSTSEGESGTSTASEFSGIADASTLDVRAYGRPSVLAPERPGVRASVALFCK